MNPIIASLFSGESPSLILSTGTASADGSVLRAGHLDERAARKAAGELAGRMAPENLPVFQGLLLLWHDHWNPAHEIAQSREGEPDHDLLHAILHRREGDFANAGYWFRGAGKHACYPILEGALADASSGIASDIPGIEGGRWSPSAFLASVRKQAQSGAAETGDGSRVLRLIQAEEFRAFAAHLLLA